MFLLPADVFNRRWRPKLRQQVEGKTKNGLEYIYFVAEKRKIHYVANK